MPKDAQPGIGRVTDIVLRQKATLVTQLKPRWVDKPAGFEGVTCPHVPWSPHPCSPTPYFLLGLQVEAVKGCRGTGHTTKFVGVHTSRDAQAGGVGSLGNLTCCRRGARRACGPTWEQQAVHEQKVTSGPDAWAQ